MTKIAFQASIPKALFEDSTDCLHRVVKPMLAAIRDQLHEKGIPENLRISLMVDEVPAEMPQAFETTVTNEVRKALISGKVEDVH